MTYNIIYDKIIADINCMTNALPYRFNVVSNIDNQTAIIYIDVSNCNYEVIRCIVDMNETDDVKLTKIIPIVNYHNIHNIYKYPDIPILTVAYSIGQIVKWCKEYK